LRALTGSAGIGSKIKRINTARYYNIPYIHITSIWATKLEFLGTSKGDNSLNGHLLVYMCLLEQAIGVVIVFGLERHITEKHIINKYLFSNHAYIGKLNENEN
jgi:hypothetical protein